MKYTVLLMEGRTPKHCVGIFNTMAEAEAWARKDGWLPQQYRVMQLWP